MKKVIIFGSIIIVIFAAIAIITQMQQSSQTEGNPYGKDSLEASTIELLDDPNYQNQITPDALTEKIESGEPTTVYFFSPTCQYCRQTTPILSPLAEDMDVEMVKFNLLEFENGWNQFSIESTPTVIYYENGEEVQRVVGAAPEDTYSAFFNEFSLRTNQ
ncbi:thioredoxin family protein [Jeotgalibacillus soli]|uniref:Thioredoxin domain-containing protein n=1 Tax=Jeotgalibacillus soli TaxID=889306 RepID=A0A0C2VQN9_9BACL|nr:thioredoxin family protein [Jeotgalibacillus soli]KIL46766.1 hypothetical protein KP78_18840 [Jeotgalibacillus soli]